MSSLYRNVKFVLFAKTSNNVSKHWISMLHTSLILLILNDIAKTKLTILTFLYCEELVKNPIGRREVCIYLLKQ